MLVPGTKEVSKECAQNRGASKHLGPRLPATAQALVRLSSFQLLGMQPEDPYSYNVAGGLPGPVPARILCNVRPEP
jgi:hypothetical protein